MTAQPIAGLFPKNGHATDVTVERSFDTQQFWSLIYLDYYHVINDVSTTSCCQELSVVTVSHTDSLA